MSKPLGLSISVGESGLNLGVRMPTNVEDAIWEAVEVAIVNGWSPEQFKREVASAWTDKLRQDFKQTSEHASEVFYR